MVLISRFVRKDGKGAPRAFTRWVVLVCTFITIIGASSLTTISPAYAANVSSPTTRAAVVDSPITLTAIVSSPTTRAATVPSPTSDFFINDYAGALSSSVRAEVFAKGVAMEKATSAQVVVVIIDSLQGRDRDEYSLELLRTWGIGQKDKNNGVLLLVAISDRKVRIEVGYGLEGALPDGVCGRILDEFFVPAMSDGDIDTAVIQTYDSILIVLANEYGIDPQDILEGTDYTFSVSGLDEELSAAEMILAILMLIGVPILVGALGRRRGKSGGSWSSSSGGWSSSGGGGYSGGGGSGGGGGAGRSW